MLLKGGTSESLAETQNQTPDDVKDLLGLLM